MYPTHPGQPTGGGHPGPVPAVTERSSPRIERVPGTGYGLVYLPVPAAPSGMAIGSLVAGIASIGVSLVVVCFGLVGASDGWGPGVAGAFAALAALIGLAAIGLGVFGARQIRRAAGAVTGRGMAIAGISTGGSGVALTAVAILVALLATASA